MDNRRICIAARAAFVPFERREVEQSIPARFAKQVAVYPARPAVAMGGCALSYAELDRAANCVARALLTEVGPRPGPIVLLLDQGIALVAAILGVLKAGAFYVPLETAHSVDHVAAVVGETRPRAVLAGESGVGLAAAAAPGVSVLRVDPLLRARGGVDAPDLAVAPDEYAYVYFTSGSTGRPKGVADTHRNVLHNVMRYTNSLAIDRDDRLTLLQSPSFSGAVSSLFCALLNGATVIPYDVRRAGTDGLGTWLVRERITIYHSVPALFRHAVAGAAAFPDLRLIRLEGDRMSRHDWQLFRERTPDGCRLVNGLGATECGLVRQLVVDHAIPVADGVVPVGYPVEDMEVEIVDEAGCTVAAGGVGEIAVRSRFLAAGYWGRPDLTASAFATDPADPTLRTYRTGDLGRLHPDGRLDHLGRRDSRHRLRGQWVDLAEVEAALSGAAGVREAAACLHDAGPYAPRLVAYVVPDGDAEPSPGDLRRHLAARLPANAVPAAFVTLERLPLTENGKLDRGALPPPVAGSRATDATLVPPRTPLERVVAAIWSEVLGVDAVGVHDSFLELGGDSLLIGAVQARLRDRLGAEPAAAAMFEHPTVEALASYLETLVGGAGEASLSVGDSR